MIKGKYNIYTLKKNRKFKKKTQKNNLNYCSPRNSNESFTCFSRPSLKRIIKYWNESNADHPILYDNEDSRSALWSKINKKLSAICDNEYCWIKQPFITKKRITFDDYRPEMPSTWENNKTEWLTTKDIERVMNQYMNKYDDFYFIGAVPIDFDKHVFSGMCVVNELCRIKIPSLLKKGINKIGIIFNLDPHDKPGSHWVSFYGDIKQGRLYYFDSYGFKPPDEIKKLIDRLIQQGKSNNISMIYKNNNIRHQYKESECGIYSINFIEKMLDGKKFDSICKNKIPDDEMLKSREKYFTKII